MRLKYRVLAAAMLLGINSLNAQKIERWVASLTGTAITATSPYPSLKCADTAYFNTVLQPQMLNNGGTINNIIDFRLNENYNKVLPDTFTITLNYTLKYSTTSQTGSFISLSNQSLIITYSKTYPYKAKANQIFQNARYAEVEVTSVSIADIPTAQNTTTYTDNVKEALQLYNMFAANRGYNLTPPTSSGSYNCDNTSNAITTVQHTIDEVSDEIVFSVNATSNEADYEYQLEYTYIDNSALAAGVYSINEQAGGTLVPDRIFENNATRVTMNKSLEFRIQPLYDKDGKIFYRVRKANLLSTGEMQYTAWSTFNYPTSTTGLGIVDFSAGHESDINWQATTTFAEDGKYKSVIQYFDGSLRSRQTVTKANNNQEVYTVVAETFYDYQGRPAIQVLPAPTLSKKIEYTPGFNTFEGTHTYYKDAYDPQESLNNPGQQYCAKVTPKLNKLTSGAAQYYSDNNPEKNDGFNKFIPDAKGYPYTETKYTPDNTGRIAAQSGVGEVHQLGSGKETKYYYGDPEQEDLDALFGTEAGYAAYYEKNMVQDANGQLSISYVDMHGRTVATALAGKNPDHLEKLASNPYNETSQPRSTIDLISPASNVIQGNSIILTKSLLVNTPGVHNFTYGLDSVQMTMQDCQEQNICFDCLYDLEITVTDDCGNAFNDGQPYVYTNPAFKLYNVDAACGTVTSITSTFSLTLQPGSYNIVKKLSVNLDSMYAYRDSVFLKKFKCKTFEEFYQEELDIIKTSIDCEPVSSEYTDLDSFLDEMKGQVSPSGGCYAVYGDDLSAYPDVPACSTLNIIEKELYKQLSDYRDEDGNPAMVNGVAPQYLSKQEFVNNFDPAWANELVKLHPEYCVYKKFEEFKTSFDWEKDFKETQTYAEAKTKGYLNPKGSGAPASFPVNLTDPIFGMLGIGSTNEQSLSNAVFNKIFNNSSASGTQTFNLWAFSTVFVKCWEANSGAINTSNQANEDCKDYWIQNSKIFSETELCEGDLNMAWQVFRDQYLAAKRNWFINYAKAHCISNSWPYYYNEGEVCADYRIFRTQEANNSNTPSQEETNTNNQITSTVTANCEGYKDQWREQLQQCGTWNTTTLETVLNHMVEVCKKGGDVNHLLGSSTIKPGATYTYKSFVEVINAFKPSGSTCSGYDITTPKPYEHSLVLGNKPVITRPDDCECTKINNIYKQYATQAILYGTFSSYLKTVYKIDIAQSKLTTLLNVCNDSKPSGCNYLTEAIYLPPIFQCVTVYEPICIECSEMKQAYDQFKKEFNLIPAYTVTTTEQERINNLFKNFMNHRFGFNYPAVNYLEFMDKCQINYNIPAEAECNRLNQLLQNYQRDIYNAHTPVYDSSGCDVSKIRLNNSDWYFGDNPEGKTWEHNYDYKLAEWMKNGVYTMPEKDTAIQPVSYFSTNLVYVDSISLSNTFSVETRIKFPIKQNHKSRYLSQTGVPAFMYGRQVYSYVFDSMYVKCTLAIGDLSTGLPDDSLLANFEIYDLSGNMLAGHYNISTGLASAINWFTLKVTGSNNIWRLYINGQKKDSINYQKQFNVFRKMGMHPLGYDLHVDWIKMFDADSTLRFMENFNGCSDMGKQTLTRVNSTCQQDFVSYFNTQRGTSYTFNQIDDLYYTTCGIHPNPCYDKVRQGCTELRKTAVDWYLQTTVNPYNDPATGVEKNMWGFGYNYVARDLSSLSLKDFVREGILSTPESVTENRGDFMFAYNPALCMYNNYSLEIRMRSKPGFNPYNVQFNQIVANNGNNIFVDLTSNSGANGFFGYYTNPNGSLQGFQDWSQNATMFTLFNTWKVYKLELKNDRAYMYMDGVLKGQVYFPTPRTGVGFNMGGWYDAPIEYDWVKISDNSGTVKFFEDFEDYTSFARPDFDLICHNINCTSTFTAYYNSRFNTSLTYAQIAEIYKTTCGIYLPPCNAEPLNLCGKPSLSFDDLPENENCADTATFAYYKAMDRYTKYLENLKTYFEQQYMEHCLRAAQKETFTVDRPNAEYHYTLYYYDQAGNLVKTVPPAGVNKLTGSALASVKTNRAAGTDQPNNTHTLATVYRYNSLNQVVEQHTPDAGTSKFWYDRLGRLVVSQNAKQAALEEAPQYSYTLYDNIGRITEVGQKSQSTQMTQSISTNPTSLQTWLDAKYNTSTQVAEQVTSTVYDVVLPTTYATLQVNQNTQTLRNRVSYTVYYDVLNTTSAGVTTKDYAPYTTGTVYSYDIHGNVKTLQQDYKAGLMNDKVQRIKRIDYNYDLISGKVNQVSYQPGSYDQYYHRYAYDAENKLTDVYTTRRPEFVGSPLMEDHEAGYNYYKHGPLARTTIGQLNVQGLDYAYTLQGWLKGVNSTGVNADAASRAGYDMGGDASLNLNNPGGGLATALDAYSYQLNYFSGDYTTISNTVTPFTTTHATQLPSTQYRPLYNGNINSMVVSIPVLSTATQLYNYKYDQLNRIVAMDAYTGYTPTSNSFTGISLLTAYKERITYDANGNIQTYLRNGDAARTAMDELTYSYTSGTNKLHKVTDAATNASSGDYPNYNDIKTGQADNNYVYDEIGNLTGDASENISSIEWTVYGKIKTIHKTASTGQTDRIDYTYDAAGNRISKFVHIAGQGSTTGTYTWYVRDASGNVMGIYSLTGAYSSNELHYGEAHIYGSSRLGVHNINSTSTNPGYTTSTNADLGTITQIQYIRGNKFFELSNHLGNVLVTVSDKKTAVDAGTYSFNTTTKIYTLTSTTADGIIDYFAADVITANDYYPFGMQMPGRIFTSANTYRYSINGQEKTPEIAPNTTTAMFWEYDSRIGRRWNVDPIPKVSESSYMVFGGNSISFSDPKGDDWIKKKQSDGSYTYKFDKAVTRADQTPKGFEYVGATGSYQAAGGGGFVEGEGVNLGWNGTWWTTGHFGSPGENLPNAMNLSKPKTSSKVTIASLNTKPQPAATIGTAQPQGPANDFEAGAVKGVLMVPGGLTAAYCPECLVIVGAHGIYQGVKQDDPEKIVGGAINLLGGLLGTYTRVTQAQLSAYGGSRSLNPTGGTTNCAGCAIAGNSTLNGFPATAINHGVTKTTVVAQELGGTWQTGMNIKSVSALMTKLGDGATGIVFGERPMGVTGHFFNVVNKGGTIQFLDFQKSGSAVMAESEVNQYYRLWFLKGTLTK